MKFINYNYQLFFFLFMEYSYESYTFFLKINLKVD